MVVHEEKVRVREIECTLTRESACLFFFFVKSEKNDRVSERVKRERERERDEVKRDREDETG